MVSGKNCIPNDNDKHSKSRLSKLRGKHGGPSTSGGSNPGSTHSVSERNDQQVSLLRAGGEGEEGTTVYNLSLIVDEFRQQSGWDDFEIREILGK
jgi:hypothetical protein